MKNEFGNKVNSPGTWLEVAVTAAVRINKIDNRFIFLMDMERRVWNCVTLDV